jgi:phosphate uptake regulator
MIVIEENLRFMLLEVTKQLENTLATLQSTENRESRIEKIEARDDYIDNLKSVIENDSFSRIHGGQAESKRMVDKLRAIQIVSNNLERLADHGVNIVRQTRYLVDASFIDRFEYENSFREIFKALHLVDDALFKQDMNKAFRICRAEFNLDAYYKVQFDRILRELRQGKNAGDLVTTLFIQRYLERIGDAILNIGEAIIFSILGDKFKIRQYNALKEVLSDMGDEAPISDVEFESIWGTRSGCRIGKVHPTQDGKETQSVIFKEGNRSKLIQEKENIERWEEIMPGLPPKVVALREEGGQASLLIEYLGGCTVQDVVLTAEQETLDNVMFLVEQTLTELWEGTLKQQQVHAGYVHQLRSRLEDVYRLHPRFEFPHRTMGPVEMPSIGELLEAAGKIDETLPAPFSVFIHGDFNINNVIYDHEEQRIHYIDLHRSRDTDFVQDVSVSLVSNFRLPVFEDDIRNHINQVIDRLLAFARGFAVKNGDETFDARLALGLARSFMTSTRFELNKEFAKTMYHRGVFLLDRVVQHAGPYEEFELPAYALYY